ncbi:MAG: FtsX-like permease family protein [Bryobacteraceae bacterium]
MKINDRDRLDQPKTAVVNETMARRFGANLDHVVGQRFRFVGSDWITVVGVARDVRPEGVDWATSPAVFVSEGQFPSTSMTVVARAKGQIGAVADTVRKLVWSLESEASLDKVESLENLLTRRMASSAAIAEILGCLAGAAICLAVIGVYGLLAYVAAQRTREIGLRIALGANRGAIFRMILAQGSRVVLLGLCAGLPLAYAVAPLLRSLLVGVQPHDWVTGISVPCLLFSVALIACGIPAWRATRIDPAESLRME